MSIPAYLPYFVFAGTAVTVIAILYGLHRVSCRGGWPQAERTRTFRTSSALLLGWLAADHRVSAALGVYHVGSTKSPPSNTASCCRSWPARC